MKQEKACNRGIFYTMAAVLLIIPIILLSAFYMNSTQTRIEDTTSRIRCDELHYFVEDTRQDLARLCRYSAEGLLSIHTTFFLIRLSRL